ncbi:hypothetical protein SAMN05877753_10926 [Bacillus oleivorans]|uniref:Uncharacterized protein n=1 Tax=Bacillus oleivorans TaxID=1448271 RepID=A0A285D3Q5_9BACI|nr:hypothetical protein [Bacillus oleivorans]SNX74325.1 hypothetical protein SAMN05877753_10926 [Bacillus oleivorans]
MRDLWGFSKLNKSDLKSMPQGILKEQGDLFEKKTDGKLLLKTSTRSLTIKADERYGLATNFEIVAPYLDGYSYTLFTMYSMPETDYPVAITLNSTKVDDVFIDFDFECNNEAEFLNVLGTILGSEDTTKVVKNLYSKSFINDDSDIFN